MHRHGRTELRSRKPPHDALARFVPIGLPG
jgi:hypothetical protein